MGLERSFKSYFFFFKLRPPFLALSEERPRLHSWPSISNHIPLWSRTSFEAICSYVLLDAFPLDFRKQLLIAPHKVWVDEALVTKGAFFFVEVIHVELSDEGSDVLVLKELRKDLILELIQFLNQKAFTFRRPCNDRVIFLIIYDLVGLD